MPAFASASTTARIAEARPDSRPRGAPPCPRARRRPLFDIAGCRGLLQQALDVAKHHLEHHLVLRVEAARLPEFVMQRLQSGMQLTHGSSLAGVPAGGMSGIHVEYQVPDGLGLAYWRWR